jgi:hypothetical protein
MSMAPPPFADIAIIDDHAHPPLREQPATAAQFARFFTEGHDPATIAEHAPHSLFARLAVRELAAFLGCEATAAAVVAARAAEPLDAYLRRLLADAGIEAVLLDDGFPREGAMTVAEVGAAGGVRAGRLLRLETLIEELIPRHDTPAALERALLDALADARPGLVGLKSIIAYRAGLAIERPAPADAARALAETRSAWGGRPGRLTAKPLLDHLLPLAAEWAAANGLPLQLHTGFGDRDLDLRLANPLHLRPLLEDGALASGPLVLLHGGYPFVREAAYLASVYPNVYVDCSLAAPLLAGPGLTRALEELLALAPVTKLLYGSDAWGIPEWFWLAARAARRALGEALAWLPPGEADWAARRILHANAAELYRLGAP